MTHHQAGAHPWAPNHHHRGVKRPIEILTPDEVRRLMGAYSAASPSGIRGRALVAVLYRGGLRISEALQLEVRDVDDDAGLVVVRHGKGDKRRAVAIDPSAMSLLMRWIDARRKVARRRHWSLDGARPVFCTLAGAPIYPGQVRVSLRAAASRAGIEKRVHPHGLRHTMAYELAMERVPLPVISQQLGHTSVATTDRYINHIAPRDVIAAIHARDDWTHAA